MTVKRLPITTLPNGINIGFVALDCGGCGVIFAVTRDFEARRREDQKRFHCPNGCGMSFSGETPAETAARDARADAAWWRERALGEERRLEAEKRSHAATKGVLTKTRKRAENGVCLHCHRTFANVARHVANKHPGIGES